MGETASAELSRPARRPAIKADLLRRLDRKADAATEYERALTLADNDAERAFLASRLAETGLNY